MDSQNTRVHTFHAGRLVIIESLEDGQYKSGQFLFNQLKAQESQLPQIDYVSVEGRSDLLNLLTNILEQYKSTGLTPMLHLVFHGNDDGIYLRNGDFVEWYEFSTHITNINIATGNNLFITMSSCFGFHVAWIQAFNHERSSFFMEMGRTDEYQGGEFTNDYVKFYSTMASDGIDKAIHRINEKSRGYSLYFCEQIFLNILNGMLKKGTDWDKVAYKSRMNFKRAGRPLPVPKSQFNKYIYKQYYNTLLKWRETFFLVDLYSKNDTRFVSREKVSQIVKSGMKKNGYIF